MDRYLSCEFHAYLPYSAGGCQQYLLSQRRRKVLKSGGGHCVLKWVLCGHFLAINIHQRIKNHEILDCDWNTKNRTPTIFVVKLDKNEYKKIWWFQTLRCSKVFDSALLIACLCVPPLPPSSTGPVLITRKVRKHRKKSAADFQIIFDFQGFFECTPYFTQMIFTIFELRTKSIVFQSFTGFILSV